MGPRMEPSAGGYRLWRHLGPRPGHGLLSPMKSFTHTALSLVSPHCWAIDATMAPFDIMQKARCATMAEHSSGPLIDVSLQAGMVEN
ncbi:uncharacterized protein TrAFT101_009329 [Trichoderma asperellum]|uniref:uncharacterized protein n=1 Tax=Trichoderma asperellum TaxID=101201 RepID=UPI003319D2A9|nr:hypothetical protein TrAFT101_009329 [Trichoderma asperellum]